jgi:hypothetical protein
LKKLSVKNKTFITLALILFLTGCGLKSNPEPPMFAPSPGKGEQALTVTSDGNAVVLTWLFQNRDEKINYINIEKSELGSAGNICRDCPRVFHKISQISVQNEINEYRFTDQGVERGKFYSYRLRLCDEAGVCRESSAKEIEIK